MALMLGLASWACEPGVEGQDPNRDSGPLDHAAPLDNATPPDQVGPLDRAAAPKDMTASLDRATRDLPLPPDQAALDLALPPDQAALDLALPPDQAALDLALPPDQAPPPDSGTPVHLKKKVHSETLLFDPAKDKFNISYHSFRIPAITRTKAGTLLAFVEGRACSSADFGNINMVYKRSTDHGKTWSKLAEVVGAGPGTWGNPTPVSDMVTGTVWLFMSFNAENISQYGKANPCTGKATKKVGPGDRAVYVSKSTDDGKTWSKPVNMTATLQPAGRAWDAVGPGIGIQTSVANKGRLIIPAINRNIYSDDHGKTWKMKAIPTGTSEGAVVELSSGALMRNDRAVGSTWSTAKRRWVSSGTIAGSFVAFKPHNTLLDPRCQGSILRYTVAPSRVLFLNPASTISRCKMRVRISYDDGKTWARSRRVHDYMTEALSCAQHRGGYSSMIKTADFHVAALMERGGTNHSVEFHRFNLPWILNGTPEP